MFIPKKINVGFNKRNDTYTGKLAYVIYYDEKNVLRKESSWQSWRDKEIPNEVYENNPIEGFVLNRKVGDYASGWNHRKSYCRVYDPRGFEFEIGIENLLYILENTNSIKGKGLEGEFVYGWDGKDLVLLPVSCKEYKDISEKSSFNYNKIQTKAKDLIIGATYYDNNKNPIVYLGRFDYFEQEKYYDNNRYNYNLHLYSQVCNASYKGFWFGHIHENDTYGISCYKTISKKVYDLVDNECSEKFSELFELLSHNSGYCKINENLTKCIKYTWKEFEERIDRRNWWVNYFSPYISEYQKRIEVRLRVASNKDDYYTIEDYNQVKKYLSDEIQKKLQKYVVSESSGGYYSVSYDKLKIPTLEEFYEAFEPCYYEIYLENGNLYTTTERD